MIRVPFWQIDTWAGQAVPRLRAAQAGENLPHPCRREANDEWSPPRGRLADTEDMKIASGGEH